MGPHWVLSSIVMMIFDTKNALWDTFIHLNLVFMKHLTLKPFILLCIFLTSSLAYAGEGMWLPQLLKLLNEKEMQSMGMKISAEDIYSINLVEQ